MAGKPLIAWTASTLAGLNLIDRKICTTDSSVIADICKDFDLEVPFLRPAHLATDKAEIKDVVRHALNFYSKSGEDYSHVLLLQATSPTVNQNDITEAIDLANKTDADTIISCYKHENEHPSLLYYQDKTYLQPVEQRLQQKRRQDQPTVLVRTGLFYLIKVSSFLESLDLIGRKVACVEIEKERSITIDTMDDWIRCEQYLMRV